MEFELCEVMGVLLSFNYFNMVAFTHKVGDIR